MKFLRYAAGAAVAALACSPAFASDTLSAQYFSVTPGGDFGSQCCSTVSNLVKTTLGPDGLPVYNSSYGGSYHLTDLNSSGELTWWSPASNPRVTSTGSGTITLPFSDSTFFVPNGTGTSNATSFLTAIFSGTLNLPTMEPVSFTFGGDDDMFLFVDGQSVGQIGGVHPNTVNTVSTSLSAGDHAFTAFYADRAQSQASASLSVNAEGLRVSPPVPEPATWAMMLVGFGGIGFSMRRKRKSSGERLAQLA